MTVTIIITVALTAATANIAIATTTTTTTTTTITFSFSMTVALTSYLVVSCITEIYPLFLYLIPYIIKVSRPHYCSYYNSLSFYQLIFASINLICNY